MSHNYVVGYIFTIASYALFTVEINGTCVSDVRAA